LRVRGAVQQTVAARQITRGRREIVARSSAEEDIRTILPPCAVIASPPRFEGRLPCTGRGSAFGKRHPVFWHSAGLSCVLVCHLARWRGGQVWFEGDLNPSGGLPAARGLAASQPGGIGYGRASSTMLNGVRAASRTLLNPATCRTSPRRAGPAWAPSAIRPS
jgi:hypothetical protein